MYFYLQLFYSGGGGEIQIGFIHILPAGTAPQHGRASCTLRRLFQSSQQWALDHHLAVLQALFHVAGLSRDDLLVVPAYELEEY